MMKSEFIERTGFEPTEAEYGESEAEYMGCDIDKDEFCKTWKKQGGIQRLMRLRARRIEELEAELAKENPIPTGMSKADYAEMRFEDALVEDDDFDLLVMGRTQGKGCYCYVNGLLQTQLAKYQNNYPYIVVDNEAGMEHISRGVLPSMQTAILVSDCSRRGVQAVGRIAELIKECDMHPDTVGLIINRAPKGELNKGIQEDIANQGLTLLGVVPQDETVYEYDCEGRPTSTLPEDNPVKTALRAIVDNLKL